MQMLPQKLMYGVTVSVYSSRLPVTSENGSVGRFKADFKLLDGSTSPLSDRGDNRLVGF